MDTQILTAGIDIGNSSVKVSIVKSANGKEELLCNKVEKIRKRKVSVIINDVYDNCLDIAGLRRNDIQYVATTGDKENVEFRTGHFYSMTTHARGAHFFDEEARSVVDVGAFYIRALKIDDKGRVIAQQMTGQCASGTGQFVENIARYLGIGISDVGPLSLQSSNPERISSICAVLSETDVINMVSRGVKAKDIMKGIQLTISDRIIKMLSRINGEFPAFLTGGMSGDAGLLSSLNKSLDESGVKGKFHTNDDGVFAGSIGAAILGAVRYSKIMAPN